MRLFPRLAPALAVCLTLGAAQASPSAPAFPGNLERYLTTYVKLDAPRRAKLLAGQPVSTLLESDPAKEVAVFGAVWIDAPIARYVAALEDIERFESGEAFRVTKKISSPDFPRATLTNSDSFVYWQEATFGLKPTIRINHVVISQQRDGAIVASKMIYATHYFWTALELRVLLRDPQRGQGFWFVTESRSRSDGLSGFTGRVIRGRVRGESEKGTAALLQLTRQRLERPAR